MKTVIYFYKNKVKRRVLETLYKPKTPTQISKELKIHRTSVSRILLEVEKKGFVKCINPQDISGRFYSLTDKGGKAIKRHKAFVER